MYRLPHDLPLTTSTTYDLPPTDYFVSLEEALVQNLYPIAYTRLLQSTPIDPIPLYTRMSAILRTLLLPSKPCLTQDMTFLLPALLYG